MASSFISKQDYDIENIQKIAIELEAMPPVEQPKRIGKIQAIRMLEPSIKKLLSNGYTLPDIVNLLSEKHGLKTSVSALRTYLPKITNRGGKSKSPLKKPPIKSATSLSSSEEKPLQPGEFRIAPDLKDL